MESVQQNVSAQPSPRSRGGTASSRRHGQVRAIARAAGRGCSRPGCDTPAAATLVFSYDEQVARLVELFDERDPQTYDLCPPHADRTRPPMGWELADTRPPPSDAPRRLDEDETVAVLAAVLRGEAPPTRVSVLPGGAQDEPEAPDEPAGAVTPVVEPMAEDPLRAALEELQRLSVAQDDTAVDAATVPMHERPAEQDDPTLW